MAEVQVVDNPRQERFEAFVDGKLAGVVTYRIHPDRIIFDHTEVDDAFEGHGVGSRLARHVLDDARARGLAVTPRCPFIRAYIEHHPEYADLVAPAG